MSFKVNLLFIFVITVVSNFSCVQAMEDYLVSDDNFNLETERFKLRLLRPEDAANMFEFTSNPDVAKYTGLFELHKNIDETKVWLEKHINHYKNNNYYITWAILDRATNKAIGFCGFEECSTRDSKAELVYAVNHEYWKKGVATEAAQKVIDFGFNVLELNRIWATYDPRNIASGKVLKKCNLVQEGLLRELYFFKGEYVDRVMLGILHKEYMAKQKSNHN
jgi:ribosomal-protein-alanine N-acetyltransferase